MDKYLYKIDIIVYSPDKRLLFKICTYVDYVGEDINRESLFSKLPLLAYILERESDEIDRMEISLSVARKEGKNSGDFIDCTGTIN